MHDEQSNTKRIFFKGSIALVFLTLGISLSILAQDDAGRLRIVEVEQAEGEIIRKENYDNYDVNGNLAAGLIIQADMGGLTFTSSNGIIRQSQKGNEWRLLVSNTEREITVYGDGVLPLNIVLASEGVKLESGKFWQLQIASNITREKLPVIFDINEDDPTLLVENEVVEYTKGRPVQLSIGTHIINIEKTGFNPISDTIEVSQNNVFFTYTLQETTRLSVGFRTEPSGATITIGESQIPSPTSENDFITEFLFPGTYDINIVRAGYLNYDGEITVVEGNTNQFTFPLIRNIGYLVVESETPNAVLLVDDKPYDFNTTIELPPRNTPYEVSIRSKGFKEYEERQTIELGDTLRINQDLEMITGDVFVRLNPQTATLELKQNGTVIGTYTGSEQLKDLQIGTYELVASQNNFRTASETFELREGDVKDISFNLEQIDGVGSLSLSGLEGSKVTLKGPRAIKIESLPRDIATLPYGVYELVAEKKGFKTITQNINFRQSERSIDLINDYVPKTKGKAFFRAALFPGAGHFYLDKGGRGVLYLLAEGALVGLTVKSYQDYSANADAYRDARNNYTNAINNFDNLNQIQQSAFEAQENSKNDIILFLTALGAVKGLELVDVLLSKSHKKELNRAKQRGSVRANPATASISFNYNF